MFWSTENILFFSVNLTPLVYTTSFVTFRMEFWSISCVTKAIKFIYDALISCVSVFLSCSFIGNFDSFLFLCLFFAKLSSKSFFLIYLKFFCKFSSFDSIRFSFLFLNIGFNRSLFLFDLLLQRSGWFCLCLCFSLGSFLFGFIIGNSFIGRHLFCLRCSSLLRFEIFSFGLSLNLSCLHSFQFFSCFVSFAISWSRGSHTWNAKLTSSTSGWFIRCWGISRR